MDRFWKLSFEKSGAVLFIIGCIAGLYLSSCVKTTDCKKCDIVVSHSEVYPGDTLNFTTKATWGTSFNWYFGNGDSSNSSSPSYVFSEPGTYDISLFLDKDCPCGIKTISVLGGSAQRTGKQQPATQLDFSIDNKNGAADFTVGDVIQLEDRSGRSKSRKWFCNSNDIGSEAALTYTLTENDLGTTSFELVVGSQTIHKEILVNDKVVSESFKIDNALITKLLCEVSRNPYDEDIIYDNGDKLRELLAPDAACMVLVADKAPQNFQIYWSNLKNETEKQCCVIASKPSSTGKARELTIKGTCQ